MADIAVYGKELAGTLAGKFRTAGPNDKYVRSDGSQLNLPSRYVAGLNLRWADNNNFTLEAGRCRDSANAGDITLSSRVTVSKSSSGAINTREDLTLTGTGTKTAGGLTGSGTAFLTEFAPNATPRAGSGTITTVGTAVTGTSTQFASGQLAVGDLIGNASNGYSRVTAIDSDTSATLAAAIPGGDLTGASYNVLENLTVTCVGETRRVNTITSDTALSVQTAWTTSGAGQTITTGQFVASFWAAAWVVSGTSGSGGLVSTQRTALLNPPTGYTTSQRRVGWIRLNSSGQYKRYFYQDGGITRRANIVDQASAGALVSGLTGNQPWADLLLDDWIPPTARQAWITGRLELNPPSLGQVVFTFRERNQSTGFAGTSKNRMTFRDDLNDTDSYGTMAMVRCDGAQAIEFRAANDGVFFLFAPFAYIDTL